MCSFFCTPLGGNTVPILLHCAQSLLIQIKNPEVFLKNI